ncbi:MAG TPA: hypothetical protein PKD53_21450 [Chloroflexaceae bacterium]|nr:hypothetical protein [Chloroflexaceae bacterium]
MLHPPRTLSRRTAAHWATPAALFALSLGAYLALALLWLPPDGLWSPDEGAKLLQLRSLRWEDGAPRYDLRYPGRDLDPGLVYAGVEPTSGLMAAGEGRLQLRRLPVFPALSWPLYALLGPPGLYLLPAVAGAASVAITAALARPGPEALAAGLLVAAASPVAVYSALFWEHTPASCLGLAALALAARDRPAGPWWAVGALLAAAAYLRLELAIFGGALLVAAWWLRAEERRGVLLAAAMLGLALALYSPLHILLFGVAVPDNARYLFYPLLYLRGAGLVAVRDLLIGPPEELGPETGLAGWAWAVAAVVAVGCAWAAPRPRGLLGMAAAVALGVCAVAAAVVLNDLGEARSAHGLLIAAPWAVVGLCGARAAWRGGDPRARLVVAIALLGLAGYTVGLVGLRAGSPHGGLEWGARFALTFYPLLALVAVHGLREGGERAALTLLLALGLLGAGFQARGLWVIQRDKAHIAALNTALAGLPAGPVVTDLWWLPFTGAPVYDRRAIFVTNEPEALAGWVERARAAGLERFSFVTVGEDGPSARGLRRGPERRVGAVRLVEVRILEGGP